MLIINTLHSVESADTLLIPVVDNDKLADTLKKVARLGGVAAETLQTDFTAKAKETQTLYPSKKNYGKIVVLGLGKTPKTSDIISVLRSYFYKNKAKLTGNVTVDLKTASLEKSAEFVANGIFLAPYEIGFLKTDEKSADDFFSGDNTLTFITGLLKSFNAEAAIEKGKATAEAQRHMLRLVDSPANYKTPQDIARYVVDSGKANGFKVTVFDEQACKELGLHALLAVGQGSVNTPPRFIIMEYDGGGKRTVGLVGKGVTFDTGGVSLKPGDNMNYMKSDMGGAAAVIGTIELLAKLKAPVKVIGIVPATENCIDGLAVKPGDVINSYAGKTIEVINTDAEGRLILADGLNYMAKNYNPDVMIDLATLTGSAIRALGYTTAAMMANNDKLADQLYAAANQTNEKVWRLPLWDDEYKDMMKSDIADIMNLSVAPVAGAITAAKFLEFFTNEHPNWAHLDIAGVAFGSSEYGSMKSATAYGIRLLTEFILKM